MVARYREIARSHKAGRTTNSSGPIRVRLASRAMAGKTQPISPMSWYSGSQETALCRSSPVSRQKPFRISTWAATARWLRATGLGSTVVPEENWIRARSAGSTAAGSTATRGRSPIVRQPSSGLAADTASPSRRRTRESASTRRAPDRSIMRAVRCRYSPIRPSRTGG
jgi:hypothetical protein